eukprot:jgi/Bigna1/67424/fgenesh1_pg.3_\
MGRHGAGVIVVILDGFRYRYYLTGDPSDLHTLPSSPRPLPIDYPFTLKCWRGCIWEDLLAGLCSGFCFANAKIITYHETARAGCSLDSARSLVQDIQTDSSPQRIAPASARRQTGDMRTAIAHSAGVRSSSVAISHMCGSITFTFSLSMASSQTSHFIALLNSNDASSVLGSSFIGSYGTPTSSSAHIVPDSNDGDDEDDQKLRKRLLELCVVLVERLQSRSMGYYICTMKIFV